MADFTGIFAPTLIVNRTYAVSKGVFNYRLPALVGASIFGPWSARTITYPLPAAPNNYAGLIDYEGTPGFDWFEAVHILPRTSTALGVVVANLTVLFEIFNAYRATTITLGGFTNGIGTGVSVPDLPALPFSMAPFASLLDPTSTRLAPVRIEAVVARDGVPLFDGALAFAFSTGETMFLRLSGTRVSLLPLFYETEFVERWTFPGEVLEAIDGTEQVINVTANPVQAFGFTFKLDGTDRQRLQAWLFGAQDQLLAMPLWHEDTFTTASASATATTLTVGATADLDYRVGGLAVIFESATKFDVLVLSAVGANSLTFTTTPLLNSYAAGIRVAPVALGFFVNAVDSERSFVLLESFRVAFQVTDNDTGMFTGSTTGWSSQAGKVLLDDCNVVDGGSANKFVQRVTLIDNGTGRTEVFSGWATNRRGHPKGFTARGRAAYRKLKRLLLALRGPQVSFYIPTFAEDLTVVGTMVATTALVDVTNIGYTKNVQARAPKVTFRITFTDGSSLVRSVQSSVEIDASTERLTLDATWPTTRTPAEVVRVEFLELSRFDTFSFTFAHRGGGLVTLTAPVKTLNA